MGGSTQVVPERELDPAAASWSREIRDYLLGRLAAAPRAETMPRAHELPPHVPIRRWWTFEGKRYGAIDGTLAASWPDVIRMAAALDRTFNPRLRLSERTDGIVDWGQTLSRGPLGFRTEYVVRSSNLGLDDEERAALRGWAGWIAHEWSEYCAAVRLENRVQWGRLLTAEATTASLEQLRRWAHAARRSRWPLLRHVVAESLRPTLEPEELDRVPLPSERAQLFEVLCLVRFARHLAPVPRELRWLDPQLGGNRLELEGVTLCYQQWLEMSAVLATSSYAPPLSAAIGPFGLRAHRSIDIAIDFAHGRNGFDGIIIEAKSGAQKFDDAVGQLRVYREARTRRPGSRFLVWGIAESPSGGSVTPQQLDHLRSQVAGTADVWLFSDAESIERIVSVVLETTKQN